LEWILRKTAAGDFRFYLDICSSWAAFLFKIEEWLIFENITGRQTIHYYANILLVSKGFLRVYENNKQVFTILS
jgi:hypothetical protein